MKYARYIDECTIDEDVPREAYDPLGRLVVGDLTTKPELLVQFNFFPLIESEEPEAQEGCHVEKRYAPGENQVIQTWVQVQDPIPPSPPPTQYSKLKILLEAQNAGMGEAFVGLLQSNSMLKMIWDASNTIEDNELLDQYLPSIAEALGKTTDEIKAFLDENCAVD